MERIEKQYEEVMRIFENLNEALYILGTIIEEETDKDSPFTDAETLIADAEEAVTSIVDECREEDEETIKVRVTDIEWDTDDEDDDDLEDLPTEMTIEISKDIEEDDIEEAVGDAITEETGFLHKGFAYEII